MWKCNKEIKENEEKNKGDLVLIIDGNCLFYDIGENITYFPLDYEEYLKKIQKVIDMLLSIENLKKIFIVFDGFDNNSKKIIKSYRDKHKINSIFKLYKRIFILAGNEKNIGKKNFIYWFKYCPSPIEYMTFIQYLIYNSEKNTNLEIKFAHSEADKYIAKLAMEENGYVVSSDTDFFIYDIPKGVIQLESILDKENRNWYNKDPENNQDNRYFKIKKCTIDKFKEKLGFTKDWFPIFATLLGNDYAERDDSIIRLITNNNNCESEEDKVRLVEELIFYIQEKSKNKKPKEFEKEILDYVEKNKNEEEFKKYKEGFHESINHYNINSNSNEIKITKELIKSYKNGTIDPKLLQIISNKEFRCYPYLECIYDANCWNISNDLRKEMYKLILYRNEFGYDESKKSNTIENKYTIIEYIRKPDKNENKNENFSECSSGNSSQNSNKIIYKMTPFEVPIKIKKNDYNLSDKKERFNLYLEIFKSNTYSIKELPYYLVPLASSLRYYLNMKKESSQYISRSEKDKPLVNDIYDYEFDALIASCIAALTLTFLNYKVYKENGENLLETKSIKIDNFLINEQRLKLCSPLSYKKICKLLENENDNYQFKRETQILAEFRNILYMNSNFLQILKITDDKQEYQQLSTMHHYIWEEAFHKIIYNIEKKFNKDTNIENIETLFNYLFKKIDCNYIKHLITIYDMMQYTIKKSLTIIKKKERKILY